MIKVGVVIGTRPEIIKVSPVIHALDASKTDYSIIHTGQHYSYNMDRVFFESLKLPKPDFHLDVGSASQGAQTGRMLEKIEKVLLEDYIDVVLVQGDTNTVLAGALAGAKLDCKVGHIEAGLRSYDTKMPEEVNRILTDHCSDYLFAPTEKSKQILLGEGILDEKIFVTGNTIVDAVHQNLDISQNKVSILDDLELTPKEYFLVTAHRKENVDDKKRFTGIIKGLKRIADEFDLPIVYPIHPRARKMLNRFNLRTDGIKFVEPVDYLSFLQLESKAKLVLTDSGGIQEEACILQVPCVTLRDNTERQETLDVGSNVLAGTNPSRIFISVKKMLDSNQTWSNPFGKGDAGEKIVELLVS